MNRIPAIVWPVPTFTLLVVPESAKMAVSRAVGTAWGFQEPALFQSVPVPFQVAVGATSIVIVRV